MGLYREGATRASALLHEAASDRLVGVGIGGIREPDERPVQAGLFEG